MLMSIGCISLSDLYIKQLKHNHLRLLQWTELLGHWRAWITNYRYSLTELITHTFSDPPTADFVILKDIKLHTMDALIETLQGRGYLNAKHSSVLITAVSSLGQNFAEAELKQLSASIDVLNKLIKENEIVVKERTTLCYKLVPLLCAAIAIILW